MKYVQIKKVLQLMLAIVMAISLNATNANVTTSAIKSDAWSVTIRSSKTISGLRFIIAGNTYHIVGKDGN